MFIYCGDEGQKAELEGLLGDATLLREPELSNGVDDLRFVLMVSKVSWTDNIARLVLMSHAVRRCILYVSHASVKTRCFVSVLFGTLTCDRPSLS